MASANQTTLQIDEIKRIITGLLTSLTHKCTVRQLCNDFTNTIGYPIPYKSLGYKDIESFLKSIPDIVVITGNGLHALVEGVIQPKSAHIDELVSKQRAAKKLPRRLQGRNSTLRKTRSNKIKVSCTTNESTSFVTSCSETVTNNESTSFVASCSDTLTDHTDINDDICHKQSLATEIYSYKSRVPYDIQNNLRKLINDFPNGIWCTEMPDEYRRMFRKNLCYEKYFYKTLIEMVSDLTEIFHYIQPTTDDYLIFDRNIPLPKVDELETRTDDDDADDILPKLDWKSLKSLIPSDVIHLSEIIPRYWIDKKVGEYFDISIGEIYDVSKFWTYLTFGPLDELMKDLHEFFQNQRNKYQIPEALLEEGLYITTLFEKQYHRAVIINLLPNNPKQVKVLFIDYGTVWKVNTNEIWYLPRKFAQIPCQAIRTRLSNIEPPTKHTPWKIDCTERFRELITNRDLVAEITRIDNDDKIIEIYLADITHQDKIFYINDVLVEEGFAVYTGQAKFSSLKFTTTLEYIHLCPAFCELEAGYSPNLLELDYILRNNISIDQYLPQYFPKDIKDDIDYVENQHDEYRKNFKLLKFEKENIISKNFDFSLFPIDMYNDIREIYNEKFKKVDKKSKYINEKNSVLDESKLQGSCNRKRIFNKIYSETSIRNQPIQQHETATSTTIMNHLDARSTSTPIHPPISNDYNMNLHPIANGLNSTTNQSVSIDGNPITAPIILQSTNPFIDAPLDITNLSPNNPFLPDILRSRLIGRQFRQSPNFYFANKNFPN